MRNYLTVNDQSAVGNWLHEGLEDFFGQAFVTAPTHRHQGYGVQESDAGYLLSFDLPGVRKENLKIEIAGQILTVSGERKPSVDRRGNDRTFSYSFTLPSSADAAKVEANLEDGVLEVAIPKAESAKARTVQIQSDSGGFFSKLLSQKEKTDQPAQTI